MLISVAEVNLHVVVVGDHGQNVDANSTLAILDACYVSLTETDGHRSAGRELLEPKREPRRIPEGMAGARCFRRIRQRRKVVKVQEI